MKSTNILILILVIFTTNCKEETKQLTNSTIQTSDTRIHVEKHPNGTIKITGDLVKNVRQGTWKSFYENGLQWSESTYLNGKRNGIHKTFYPNGNMRYMGTYKNEEKTGIWYFYLENGQFEKEIDFDKTTK